MNEHQIAQVEETILAEDYFREIVCYLKHSGMRAHAARLTRRVNPAFSIREALAWVDQLTHKKPISFRRLHGFDDPPNDSDQATARK